MNGLFETFQALDPTQKVFWGCAIVATAIFLVQALLTIIGIDSGDGADIDFDFADGDTMDVGGGMALFSARSFVNFWLGFGWAGVCFYSAIESKILLYIIAVVIGCLFVWMFFLIRKNTKKLESDGTINIKSLVGQQASVYLRIAGQNASKGKIQISINGSVREYDALTDGDDIPTGSKVTVVGTVDNSTVRVERLS